MDKQNDHTARGRMICPKDEKFYMDEINTFLGGLEMDDYEFYPEPITKDVLAEALEKITNRQEVVNLDSISGGMYHAPVISGDDIVIMPFDIGENFYPGKDRQTYDKDGVTYTRRRDAEGNWTTWSKATASRITADGEIYQHAMNAIVISGSNLAQRLLKELNQGQTAALSVQTAPAEPTWAQIRKDNEMRNDLFASSRKTKKTSKKKTHKRRKR